MAGAASTCNYLFLLFILSTLTVSSYGKCDTTHLTTQFPFLQVFWLYGILDDHLFSCTGKNLRTLSHDAIPSPVTLPTIVTVPATNPVTVTPTTNPAASTPLPINNPPAAPITVPGGGQQPITNPVTTYPAPTTGNVPVVAPPAPTTNNAPAVPGQSWCVAKTGASETALQSALDYACGLGAADCSLIQQGGSCYNPPTLQNHASFAFNIYYQKNPSPTSCDFGGTATIVNINPSTGTCIYPSSASSTTSQPSSTTPTTPPPTPPTPTPPTLTPLTPTPLTPTPTTIQPPPTTITSPGPAGASGSVTPPSVLNSSNPTTVFGFDGPPVTNTSSSVSAAWKQPSFIGCFTLVTSFVAGIIILEM
ncbi:hypothetical protein Ddye_029405 [Dipteronia dyeriana]|uniref:X8 domain-containing protein n=1 Tax=Dipteronia dyeriana TaxID=168575 RepID=A0AAD9TFG9_9ROSI|nr:hypothetical protein Ddye_029405 [Dipteronia dyeriana]